MWQMHYKQLYNCIDDNDSISVQEVSEACTKQKCGKAIGLDGIAMEAYIWGL